VNHVVPIRGVAAPVPALRAVRCGRRVEREHPPVEIVCEYGLSRRFKSNAAAVFRHDGEAREDFCLTNHRGEQRIVRLVRDPCSDLRRTAGRS
jgi:hypothetical protein